MATNIGGVGCDLVKGGAADQKSRVSLWQVPGVNGYGAHDLGQGESGFVYRAIKYGTEAECRTWAGQMQALQGTVLTIVDDWDATHELMLVARVTRPILSAAIGYGGARCEVMVQGVAL